MTNEKQEAASSRSLPRHVRGSMPPIPLYTVQRCRKDDRLYGSIHFSSDGDRTFCGQQTDENWWILTNDASGVATCPKCKKIKSPERRAHP